MLPWAVVWLPSRDTSLHSGTRPPLPDWPPMVATSTIEPRLPSIGIAFIRTPEAPSECCSSGGGCSCSEPAGISGASGRVPRSVVIRGLFLVGS